MTGKRKFIRLPYGVAATKWYVILSDVAFAAVQEKASNGGHRKSGKRERIRIPLERKRIATAVYTASQ